MRSKITGLTAVALSLAAFVGPSTAAAKITEFYAGNTTLKAGTTVRFSLKLGTSAIQETTDGKTQFLTCVDGIKHTHTSADVNPKFVVTEAFWGDCVFTTDILTNGSLSISTTSEPNGTLIGSGTMWTVNVGGVSCRYGYGLETTLGTVTGTTEESKEAEVDINAVVNEQEPKAFLCPDTTKWTASFVITTPKGFNIRTTF